jgi:hypothetical protein
LRAAYLAFFAHLGYRFVLRPELDVVRERFLNPGSSEPVRARMVRPERSDRRPIHINAPIELRSFAMLFEVST